MKVHNPFRVALIGTLGVGVGILLINSVQTLSTVLLYVGTALFLSLGLDPIISWLERHRMPRWSAVVVTLVGVLALFAGIVVMVVPLIVSQVSQLVISVQKFLNSVTFDDFLDGLYDQVRDMFPAVTRDGFQDAVSNVTNWLTENWGSITGGVIDVGFNILGGLAGAFIVLILTIYFTSSLPSLKKAVYQLAPASRRYRFIELSEQITGSVGLYVIGQLSLGAINGVLSAIFLTIIGAPFPAVLAVIAFFFSLIPLVGTLTGSTIIVLLCLLPGLGSNSASTAIFAAVYYLIYMQVEAYVLSPRIMNRAVSVPGGVVVVAALAGGALLGLLGALIAIPVAASVLIIYRQVVIPRQNQL